MGTGGKGVYGGSLMLPGTRGGNVVGGGVVGVGTVVGGGVVLETGVVAGEGAGDGLPTRS